MKMKMKHILGHGTFIELVKKKLGFFGFCMWFIISFLCLLQATFVYLAMLIHSCNYYVFLLILDGTSCMSIMGWSIAGIQTHWLML